MKNETSSILIPAIIIIAIAAVAFFSLQNNSTAPEVAEVADDVAPVATAPEVAADTESANEDSPEEESASSGAFLAYSEEAAANANGDTVIFFAADWCPKCQQLKNDIQANSASIPEGVTILEADFDDEVALKRQYGVTLQHTLVQIDANGDAVNTWSGSSTLDDILAEI
jgi:thiol-disulfide isomerase/thioredoxin